MESAVKDESASIMRVIPSSVGNEPVTSPTSDLSGSKANPVKTRTLTRQHDDEERIHPLIPKVFDEFPWRRQ